MHMPRYHPTYVNGLKEFVAAAESYKTSQKQDFVCCPCVNCKNEKGYPIEQIYEHLVVWGFIPGYTTWYKHGETNAEVEEENNTEASGQMDGNTGCTIPDEGDNGLERMLCDVEEEYDNEREFEMSKHMVEDTNTPLYPGCAEGRTRLGATLEFMELKASSGWTDTSFTKMLRAAGKNLPEGHTLPQSTYEAKKMMCPVGLTVVKIHACKNDCILYRKEHVDCTVSRVQEPKI